MLTRIQKFVDLPQFHYCIKCIIDSGKTDKICELLYNVEDYFLQLPDDVIINIATLVFNDNLKVRGWTNKILSIYYESMHDSVKNSEIIQTWKLVKKLYYLSDYSSKIREIDAKCGKMIFSDAIKSCELFDIIPTFESFSKIEDRIVILKNFNNISLKEFQMILDTNNLTLLWPIRIIFLENCEFCPNKVSDFWHCLKT